MSRSKKNKKQNDSTSWINLEIKGFLWIAFSLILFLSLVSYSTHPQSQNLLGLMGHTLGWSFLALFGINSYILTFYLAWMGWRKLLGKAIERLWLKHLYFGILVFSSAILLSLIEAKTLSFSSALGEAFYPGLVQKGMRYHLGGAPFYFIYRDLPFLNLHHIFNSVGISLIFSTTLLASFLFLLKIQPYDVYQSLLSLVRKLNEKKETAEPEKQEEEKIPETVDQDFLRYVKLRIPNPPSAENKDKLSSSSDLLAIQPEKNLKARPSLSRKDQEEIVDDEDSREAFKQASEAALIKEMSEKSRKRETALTAQKIHNGDFTQYSLPPLTLLTNAKKGDQSTIKKDLKKQAEVLEETLSSFGIEAKVGQINCGPTITSFEVHPAIGVKVQKIKTLDNDIALNMEAKSIRIIAPIPGKAAVGIEVPNSQPQEVGFKEMLMAYQQGSKKFHIPILLGQAVNGDYVMSDLTKMPHCIIAGATGSGKSVCINTIIMSILLNAKPDQIKLIMVDPKKVELTPYTLLPHMLAPVITEASGAAAALNWLVKEMENRYDILKLVGVRNIDSFNQRTINVEAESKLNREIPACMPYMVGIIDELADLMMVASQDIETPIARIAQMARAVGIHLILATQRPSREVITGLIKANFPTRVSFKVASRVNSQIVLDETGAESLLGNGDMLFLPPGSSHLVRAQGAFIRDEDIQKVVQHICDQAPPNYLIQSFDRFYENEGSLAKSEKETETDALYEQAKDVVLSTGNASTTFLQRKLKIGYARAASLMDQLEGNGIVGPSEGSKPRKIFSSMKAEELIGQDDLQIS